MIFATELNLAQRKNLIALMIKMSLVDGVDERETTLINQMSENLGLEVEEIHQLARKNNVQKLCSIFTDHRSKVVLIIDLVNIACADDDYTDTEKTQIYEICKLIDMPENEFKKIENWVQLGISWKKQGVDLFQ